jgi:alpha-1,6-mannosyltransferase
VPADTILGVQTAPASPRLRWPALELRALCAVLGLAGLVAIALLVAMDAASMRTYLVPAAHLRYPDWLRGPLPQIGHRLGLGRYAALLLVDFGCYLAVLAGARRLPARVAIGGLVALHVVVLLSPPLLSADVFGYLDWARMGALSHLNPYTHASGTVLTDPVHPFVRWHRFATPYGPLFTLGSYALTPLSVPAAFWVIKVLMTAAAGGCLALVWRLAKRLGRSPVSATLFVGANPLWLIYGVGGAHNDLLTMLVVLAGLTALVAGRDARAGAVLVGAIAVKASSGIVLPFALLGARRPRPAVVGTAVAALAVAILTFVVFGTHGFGFVDVLRTQQRLVAFHSFPNEFGRLIGLGGATPELRRAAQIAFGIVLIGLLVHVRRGGRWLDAAGWATLALLVASAWLLAWYAIWLLPLAALASSRWLRASALAFCLIFIVTQLPALTN